MNENYEHYISKNIQSVYKRRLIVPITYLIFLAVLLFTLPITDMFTPDTVSNEQDIIESYDGGEVYISASMPSLYFTGYTKSYLGNTIGYYYYGTLEDKCFIVLLSPNTCEKGLSEISHLTFTGKVIRDADNYQVLLENLAEDLSWTSVGISEEISSYYLSEPDCHPIFNILLLVVMIASTCYACFRITMSIIYIFMPVLSPPCQQLSRYGHPSSLLALAEEELATLPQLATEDMFITEHFFIEVSNYGIAIVPIKEIVWIYKYSTMRKLFHYHFSITYTLHITANKHLYITCPKNIKSDIDGIIDYLAEANHDILVGFNEENRLKVQAALGFHTHFEKLMEFLRKRI